MITKNLVTVKVLGHKSKSYKQRLENAAITYLKELAVTNTEVPTDISIVLTNSIDAHGYCEFNYDYKYPEIGILINKRLNANEALITLAHECVHTKQYLRKELRFKGDVGYWKRHSYQGWSEDDNPWEEEAYSKEEVLFKRYQNGNV